MSRYEARGSEPFGDWCVVDTLTGHVLAEAVGRDFAVLVARAMSFMAAADRRASGVRERRTRDITQAGRWKYSCGVVYDRWTGNTITFSKGWDPEVGHRWARALMEAELLPLGGRRRCDVPDRRSR